ncbi:MAG: SRPBCC family protein [Deltaproteobacteria bacterium]|nr:SRPBCC family protein [Deltaproteobacteria bacterium]
MSKLEDAVRIEAPPEVVYAQLEIFLSDTRNYRQWHRAHEHLEWTRGAPFQTGSICYAEAFVLGRLWRSRLIFVEVIENRHVEFRPVWPMSLLIPGCAFDLQPLDEGRATLLRSSSRLGLRGRSSNTLHSAHRHLQEEAVALKRAAEAALS